MFRLLLVTQSQSAQVVQPQLMVTTPYCLQLHQQAVVVVVMDLVTMAPQDFWAVQVVAQAFQNQHPVRAVLVRLTKVLQVAQVLQVYWMPICKRELAAAQVQLEAMALLQLAVQVAQDLQL